MSKITHRSFSDENVQSVGYVYSDGPHVRVGVALNGKHDFGIADRVESIKVLVGAIIINGEKFSPATPSCVIKPGKKIIFNVPGEAAVYQCTIS